MNPDFGRTADDYASHRAGFPDSLFERLSELGIGLEGQDVVDLGTGTGTLGRATGLAETEPRCSSGKAGLPADRLVARGFRSMQNEAQGSAAKGRSDGPLIGRPLDRSLWIG